MRSKKFKLTESRKVLEKETPPMNFKFKKRRRQK